MELMKKVNGLVLGLVILLAAGCGADEPEPGPTVQEPTPENFNSCKLTSFISDDDSVGYTYIYNQQGQVVQANRGMGQREFFQYNKLGKVSGLKIWQAGRDTVETIEYQYDVDSLLISITRSRLQFMTGVFTPFVVQNFSYDSQKRLVSSTFHDPVQGGTAQQKVDYKYTGTNSVKAEYYRFNASQNAWELSVLVDAVYDNQKTPWARIEDHISIVKYGDPFFKHNEISWKGTYYNQGPPTYTHTVTSTYTYNSAGYPIERRAVLDGTTTTITKYSYNCQ